MIRNVLAGACALAAVMVGQQAHGQSFNDVLFLAYRSNPDLTYQRAQVDGAKALVDSARAPGLPQAVISGSAGQSQLDLDQGRTSAATTQDQTDSTLQLNLSQVLYAGGRISQDTRRAKATALASEFDLIQTEQLVLGQAITAYVDILRDEAILSARNQNVEALLKQSAGVTARLREGEVTKTDVAQTEARLAQARSGAQAARANLAVSRSAFTRIVGQSPGALSPAPALPGLPTSAQEAELAAAQDTPSVKAAQSRRAATEAAIRRAAAEHLPYVSLDATAGQDRDRLSAGASGLADSVQRQDSYGLRVNVRVPLFQGGAATAGVRQAKAAERGAQASEDSVLRQARETAANAWNRMQAADAIIDSSREQARAAQVAYRGGEYELNAGLRSTFDVLDLQQDVLNAQIAVASAERDAYVARINLLQAVGRLSLNALTAGLGHGSTSPRDGLASAPIPDRRSGDLERGPERAVVAHIAAEPPTAPSNPMPAPLLASARPAIAVASVPSRASGPTLVGQNAGAISSLPRTPTAPDTAAPLLVADVRPARTPSPPPRTTPQGSVMTQTPTSPAAAKGDASLPAGSMSLERSLAITPSAAGSVNSCAVQTGAFSSQGQAQKTVQVLQSRFAEQSGAAWTIEPTGFNGQKAYRVLATGFSDLDAARGFCDRLTRGGQACFVRQSRCAALVSRGLGQERPSPHGPAPQDRR